MRLLQYLVQRESKAKQREFSGPVIKDSPLNKFNSRIKNPSKKSLRAYREGMKLEKNSMRSSRDNNWNTEIPKFPIPSIGNIAKSTNFNKNSLKNSFSSYNKTDDGLHKMINGISMSKKTDTGRRNKIPQELLNIENLRRSYDSRNARTNSAVEKLRIGTVSNTLHYPQMNNRELSEGPEAKQNAEKLSRRKGRSTSNYNYKKTKTKGNSSNRALPPRKDLSFDKPDKTVKQSNIWSGLKSNDNPSSNNLSSRPFSYDINKFDHKQNGLLRGIKGKQ